MAKQKKGRTAPKRQRKSGGSAHLLTASEKSRLIKPPDEAQELTARFVRTWKAERGRLGVGGLTPARVAALAAKAERARQREEAVRRKLEQQLAPLSDARLLAEHAAWKAVLDVYAVAKAQARISPELSRAFAFMGEAMTRKGNGGGGKPD